MAEETKTSKVPAIAATSLAGLTSALLGSFFGLTGTAIGLAVGSLVSGLAAEYYERWIRHAHTTLQKRIIKKDATAPSPQDIRITEKRKDGYTAYFSGTLLEPKKEVKKKWNMKWALAIMGITFIVGLSSITLIEFAKGSPISGGNNGTTLSGLLGQSIHTSTTVTRPTWTKTPTETMTTSPTIPDTTDTESTSASTSKTSTNNTPTETTTSNTTTNPPTTNTTPQVTTAPQLTNQSQASS